MALSTAGDDTVPQHSSGPPCHSLQSAGCFWRFHKQLSNRPNSGWDELGHLCWCLEGGNNILGSSNLRKLNLGKVPRPGVEVRRQARRKPLSTIHY